MCEQKHNELKIYYNETNVMIIDRSFGASVSAASFYIIAFVFGKTYLNLFHILGLDGCLFIYGGFGLVGIIFLYFYLPETEGKTLAEVEAHFAQKK